MKAESQKAKAIRILRRMFAVYGRELQNLPTDHACDECMEERGLSEEHRTLVRPGWRCARHEASGFLMELGKELPQ